MVGGHHLGNSIKGSQGQEDQEPRWTGTQTGAPTAVTDFPLIPPLSRCPDFPGHLRIMCFAICFIWSPAQRKAAGLGGGRVAGSRYPALSNRQPQLFWQEATSKSFEVKTSKTVLQKDASVSKTITVRNQMSPKSDLRH